MVSVRKEVEIKPKEVLSSGSLFPEKEIREGFMVEVQLLLGLEGSTDVNIFKQW